MGLYNGKDSNYLDVDWEYSLPHDKLRSIHDSLVNGQRRQAVKYIDQYGLYDFWGDYYSYLVDNLGLDDSAAFEYFRDLTISYFRIKESSHD